MICSSCLRTLVSRGVRSGPASRESTDSKYCANIVRLLAHESADVASLRSDRVFQVGSVIRVLRYVFAGHLPEHPRHPRLLSRKLRWE